MKILYGLAATAVIVFIAIQLYDRQVQRNTVHSAASDVEKLREAITAAGNDCEAVRSVEVADAQWRSGTFFVDCLRGFSYAVTVQGWDNVAVLKR